MKRWVVALMLCVFVAAPGLSLAGGPKPRNALNQTVCNIFQSGLSQNQELGDTDVSPKCLICDIVLNLRPNFI
jgi:hypothetical protein